MNVINWKYSKPLNDGSPIKKLEDKLGVSLPRDYIEFILKYNASRPDLNLFKTQNGVERVFFRLLSFDENVSVNIFNTYESICDGIGITSLLPIACDPFGNYICFDFNKNPAMLVFWNHETNNKDDITETFSDLLNLLYKSQ